nr:MAG TPA_asm: hypothetical protein [Caudoviricetes sp.]
MIFSKCFNNSFDSIKLMYSIISFFISLFNFIIQSPFGL